MTENRIFYLSHPYTGMEEKSFQNALDWTFHLEVLRGLTVYSPIRDTHQFDVDLKQKHKIYPCPKCKKERGFPKVFQIVPNPKMLYECFQCKHQFIEDSQYHFNYLKRDLILLKGFKNCVLLLHKTAYRDHINDIGMIWEEYSKGNITEKSWKYCWLSDGCRQEYECAKKNNIPVMDLFAFLCEQEILI